MHLKKIFIIFLTTFIFTSSVLADGAVGVRIGVIDTGVSFKAVNPDSVSVGKNYIFPQESTEDKTGHGTAIAGIIVGSVSAGIDGICPSAIIVPQVLVTEDEDGNILRGDTDLTAKAIYDAIDTYGCRIINISSGAAKGSEELEKAIEYAEKSGVLVVASAGNNQEKTPGAIAYPGGYPSVICVGACDNNGKVASFSQQNQTVDMLAPATDLRLASLKGSRIKGEGTSYAAAIVSATAAQLITKNPNISLNELKNMLLDSTKVVNGSKIFYPQIALGGKFVFFDDVITNNMVESNTGDEEK